MIAPFVALLLVAIEEWWRGKDHNAIALLAVACLVGLVFTS